QPGSPVRTPPDPLKQLCFAPPLVFSYPPTTLHALRFKSQDLTLNGPVMTISPINRKRSPFA
ncbi:hypothetical protein FRC15_008774, partial [Serendipita sp. 397]